MRTRRFRYGSMSAIITALVIAAVILANVIISALAAKYLWYIDITKEGLYTVSDECYDLLENNFKTVNERRAQNGEPEAKVTIKFCDMYDNLMAREDSRYVLTTALELAAHFPNVEVEYINIYENPTAVKGYKTSVHTSIINTDVIVTSGTEFRPYHIASFFLTSSGSSEAWAYFGEKRLASAILAVTQAELPVAGVLLGHGETYRDTAMVELLELAGFKPEPIHDLANYEIPDECRLLVCYEPTTDFRSTEDGISDISEIQILDDFLAGSNHSLMVFLSPDSPKLPNLENYLSLWGIQYMRTEEGTPCLVKEEPANALTSNGTTFLAQYEEYGLGASVTKDMRSVRYPQSVVFKNAMPVGYASSYNVATEVDEDSGNSFTYAYKTMGANTRQIFRIFSTGAGATLYAGGKQVESADANNTYGLMTLSMQRRLTQEDNYGASYADESSYVLACGSTDYATQAILESNVYGNSEVLMKACVTMSREAVPATLSYIPFADLTIDSLTTERANRITVLLSVIPPVLIFGAGIFVIVRRKYQ